MKICGGACDTDIIEISVTEPHEFVMETRLTSPIGKAPLHLSPTQEMLCANRMHGFLQVLGSLQDDMWALRAATDVTPITVRMIFTAAEPDPGVRRKERFVLASTFLDRVSISL